MLSLLNLFVVTLIFGQHLILPSYEVGRSSQELVVQQEQQWALLEGEGQQQGRS